MSAAPAEAIEDSTTRQELTIGQQPTAGEPPRRSGMTGKLAFLAAPLFIAVIVQSIANLFFHAVVGRALAPQEYGALGAVLAGMTLLAVPLSALQTAAARTTAEHGLNAGTARRVITLTALYGGIAMLVVVAASPLITSFLHLDRLVDAAVLGPTLLVAALLAVARGLLLGVERPGIVATSYVVSTAIRMGPGLLMAIWMGITGALLGTLLGEVAALLVVMWPNMRLDSGLARRIGVANLLTTGAAITGLFLFTTLDLFLARHFLSGVESGGYVAAATIGKTILALPAAAMSIVYPQLVQGWLGRKGWATLRSATLVVGVPAFLGALVIVVAPGLVLNFMFGAGTFPGTENVVRVLAIVAASSSLVSLLAHSGLARKSLTAYLPWLGAVIEVAAIWIWHDSPGAVAAASLGALIVTLVLMAVVELPAWIRRSRRVQAVEPAPVA